MLECIRSLYTQHTDVIDKIKFSYVIFFFKCVAAKSDPIQLLRLEIIN